MKNKSKYIAILVLTISGLSLFAWSRSANGVVFMQSVSYAADMADMQAPQDTAKARFPVKKTGITEYEDLEKTHPIDLRDPSNIQSRVEYDPTTEMYLFQTKVGDADWVTTLSMTPKEYNDYMIDQSMKSFFRSKYDLDSVSKGKDGDDFSLKDIKISLGPAERIFGPGGVRIKTQGYTEISMGLNNQKTDNPTIAEQNRNRTQFDFDQKIQMNVKASVGDKVNFDMNYDTEASFDFDSKKLKLAYEGKEDEILRRLEAGNVSMATTNSLVNGGTALFGIRADLQFGKLKISSVLSQQESQSQTVSSKGGVQTMPFEFMADQYDENRHFFLGYYFRENYDDAMASLPYIKSSVLITEVEVWKTNKRGNYEQARNIVAFADLAEERAANIHHVPKWVTSGASYPDNKANNLYSELISTFASIRDISKVTSEMDAAGLESGLDFEKIENAQLLSSSEYTFNSKTGYISLRSALQSDEVLAVAFKYTVGDKTYKVGEFSSEISSEYTAGNNASGSLILKLLKPVSMSPQAYTWHLMMKNIYSLNAYSVQKDKFRLNISYQNDSSGTYMNYLTEGDIRNQLLLRVMELDNLDSRQNRNPDGIFDFIEGTTVQSTNGRIIFPVIEPFGSHLAKKINNPAIAQKYVYQELYDSTLTVARQTAEKNKFKISGEYRASNSSEISLNATNVARGSVVVTSGGVVLSEGSDYTVDYVSGTVTIINEQYKDTPINVSLENQQLFSMQRKTMMGLNLSYDFSKDFTIGGTIMHMYEKPLTVKTEIGNESLKNTLWGLNASYRSESQWLTNLVDKLPFYNATAPSSISFTGEFAQMIPGHYENKYTKGYSYLDDFETSKSKNSMMLQSSWFLSSTPSNNAAGVNAMFPEATLSDDIEYGKNRAHLSWFNISNETFLRRNSSSTPQHIRNDKNQLSNHFVREVLVSELYPNRDLQYNEIATLTALNLSYYPEERGAYNIYTGAGNFDLSTGKLTNPEKRWGGMMRRMDNKDFEAQNYEYVEFWLMDPFVYSRDTATSDQIKGALYLNLGDVSEDVLKDGRKFYENGLPVDDDPAAYEVTNWGRVPTRQSTVYSFDNTDSETLAKQDVGYNGLSTTQEMEHHSYKAFRDYLVNNLPSTILQQMQDDPFSPLNDPAGDNYHHYRGADYDREELGILDRYKRYNGSEGNTVGDVNNKSYQTAARGTPEVEDIDQDKTMNETESYYQYRISLNPDSMDVGLNYIVDKRTVAPKLANGATNDSVTWYLFKVPVRENYQKIGSINDFKSIRFMRLFLTEFKQTTFLRFGSLDLVRGDWRTYSHTLKADGSLSGNGTLNATTVNIEENSQKLPVNYIMPPGVTRVTDPSQPQVVQENEQAMSLRVDNLDASDARAIYKNTAYDLRRYKRLQMFTHAEDVEGTVSPLRKGELTVFIRLGSDYKNNYYEYEIPLSVTPAGRYNGSNSADRYIVWPEDNMFDFPLELLKDVKLMRNKEKRQAGSTVNFTTLYSAYDPDKPNNKVSVIGNPSLAEVKVMMIGVRSNTRETKSGEIWINELRLTDFDEEGGWAVQGNMNVTLSDLATINVSGRKETIGFGSLDQSLMERRDDDFTMYNIAASIDLGKLLPEKAQVNLPFYYAYSNQTTTPKYDPLDKDVTLKESLSVVDTKAEKDSILNLAQDKTVSKNFNISNARVNIKSKKPMPYDPANFNFTYSYSETKVTNPTTAHDITQDYKANIGYSYSPAFKAWEPFKKVDSKASYSKFAKSLSLNYLPNNITINSSMSRNYIETLLRDIESYTIGGNNDANEFVSRSQIFYWDRDFNLTWDFTRNLKFSFQSGTQAEIEEPLFVNKEISKDEHDAWKEEVRKSIMQMGSPLRYNQTAKLTYNLPFSVIPILDWITSSSVTYDANYSWEKGADTTIDDLEVGNTITNTAAFAINNRFNLVTLYNKWDFLKKVNQKFDNGSGSNARRQQPRGRGNQQPDKSADAAKKRYETSVKLVPDSSMVVKHNLNTKNIKVTAKTEDGRTYPVKFKRTDNNTLTLTNIKDTASIKLSVLPGPNPEENTWYKVAQYSARGLMSVRSVTINYSNRKENYIYGFKPIIGDFIGQAGSDYGNTPGLGFAFGLDGGEDFIQRLNDRNMLVGGDSNISPAILNNVKRFDMKTQLEPIKGLKIDISATHEESDRTELQYMYAGMPRTLGGSFAMTTVALSSALRSSNSKNGYKSEVFDKFLEYRNIIAQRIENQYTGRDYPNSGFFAGQLSGQYVPGVTGDKVSPNSSDVLIPAFIAAYTGKDANNIKTTAFPSLSSILPNWTITYDGLLDLVPALKTKFKSIRINHGYTCQYRVAAYGSYSDWVQLDGDMGFIQNTINNNTSPVPTPSSPYSISSVSLTEAFNPLFGAEGTLNNSMTLRARYNNSRTVSLNTSSYQIVENLQNEFVLGMGYKITNFNRVLGVKDKPNKNFSNDLNVMADFSYRATHALIRKIEQGYTQATSGTTILTIKLSADYALSRALTLKAYFDRVVNTPLISSASYPVATTDFGLSLRFTLTQ